MGFWAQRPPLGPSGKVTRHLPNLPRHQWGWARPLANCLACPQGLPSHPVALLVVTHGACQASLTWPCAIPRPRWPSTEGGPRCSPSPCWNDAEDTRKAPRGVACGLACPLALCFDKPRDLPAPHRNSIGMPLGSALVIASAVAQGKPHHLSMPLIECWGAWHAVPSLNLKCFPGQQFKNHLVMFMFLNWITAIQVHRT